MALKTIKDRRVFNGGARPNSGPQPWLKPEDKKVTVIFYVPLKYRDKFKKLADRVLYNLITNK